MRFYLETYGCTANFGNSKDFEAALVQEGHFPSDPEKAELFVINTCAVTEKTERKILRRLRQLQGDRLIIAGCIPVALPESLKGIDYRKSLGILSKSSANEIFAGFQDNPSSETQFVSFDSARLDLCGIVNIAEGCMGTCTYCIVRNARGKLISREPDEKIESIKSLVKQGMIEIQLAGQDTAAYEGVHEGAYGVGDCDDDEWQYPVAGPHVRNPADERR